MTTPPTTPTTVRAWAEPNPECATHGVAAWDVVARDADDVVHLLADSVGATARDQILACLGAVGVRIVDADPTYGARTP